MTSDRVNFEDPTEEMAEEVFTNEDTNNDGILTVEEAIEGRPDFADELRDIIAMYDTDGDGALSRQEFINMYLNWGWRV